MKLSIITLAALLALAYAVEPDQTLKKADIEFLKKQAKILSLYVGLGSDVESRHHHEHVSFPFNDATHYKNPKALEGFIKSYERGLLDRHGVFTMFCHKNRHDTFKLFNIMYYAKDFDTFFNIAQWARGEINPLQFFYTYTMAIIHREDTRGIYTPPVFEVFPHYFISSYYMNEALAHNTFHDDAVTVHKVNSTGWEWSWHREMTTGIYSTGHRWNGDDLQARLSYFREDVGWTNSFEYWIMRFAPWLSTEKYPDIHFSHRGEHLYQFYKWLLDRYSLERLSHMLPSIKPFETDEPMPGYNSHIVDYMGRSFLARSDNINAYDANPDASWEADLTEMRVQKAIDTGTLWVKDGHMVDITSRQGFETFSKMIHGTRETYNRKYYRALIFELIEAAKEVVNPPNDRDYTQSVLGLTVSQLRDPAFYMILANLDIWYDKLVQTMPSYTQEELKFPGVIFEHFNVSKLVTFPKRRTFELTNGLPFKTEADRYKKRSYANQAILDHEPFEYDFSINSDKDQDVMIRVLIAPENDVGDVIPLTLNQMRRVFIPLNKYIVKLKAGLNKFQKHSFQPEFYDTHDNFYDFYAKVNKSIESNEPFEYSELTHCGIPYNLQLPRGTESGMKYVMFAMVTPYSEEHIDKEGYYQCRHNIFTDQHSIGYPFDRVIDFPNTFQQENMYFRPVSIYFHHNHNKEVLVEV